MPSPVQFVIPADHPALPGHFPGRPIVPGVVVLDCVLQAVARAFPGRVPAGFPSVKFLRPLLPGQAFLVQLEPQGTDRLRFRCLLDEAELATGSLRLAEAAAPT